MKAVRLENRRVFRVSGEAAESFLQGLITNDIKKATQEKALYAALLTPQGKYLFDFFILKTEDGFLFDVEAPRKDALIQKLTFYKLRASVEIEDLSERLDIWAADEPLAAGFVYPDPRLPEMGWRSFVKNDQKLQQTGRLEDYEVLRLELGIPDGSRDIEVDKRFILEADFKELNGVDFNKGCYVGQEMTARMTYRGSLKKRLLPATIEGPLPESGTAFFTNGKEAGHVLSGQGCRAMTLTRLEFLKHSPFETKTGAKVGVYVPDWIKLD